MHCLLSDLGQFTGQDGSESGTWGVRTMVSQLLVHQRIETTLGRAKELRRLADKVITISKEVCKLRRLPVNILSLETELAIHAHAGRPERKAESSGNCSRG